MAITPLDEVTTSRSIASGARPADPRPQVDTPSFRSAPTTIHARHTMVKEVPRTTMSHRVFERYCHFGLGGSNETRGRSRP